ncbi:MAG: RDD family protein [Bacteroidota bacterium]
MAIVEKPSSGMRILSMILDHMVMTFAAMMFFIPGMMSSFSSIMEVSHEPRGMNLFGNMGYLGILGFALYFCKDCLDGRSPAKRALQFQVVNNANGQAASPLRCFIRNIFIILWPLEVIVTLINPGRRIGDFVAGTRVIELSSSPIPAPINYGQVGISLALAYGLMLMFYLPYQLFMDKVDENLTTYQEESFNESLSMETAQLFTESLGNILDPDVRVYKKNNKNGLPFVSVILYVKDSSLLEEEAFDQLKKNTTELLHSKFVEGSFKGRVQFVFREPGSMTNRELILD